MVWAIWSQGLGPQEHFKQQQLGGEGRGQICRVTFFRTCEGLKGISSATDSCEVRHCPVLSPAHAELPFWQGRECRVLAYACNGGCNRVQLKPHRCTHMYHCNHRGGQILLLPAPACSYVYMALYAPA